MDFCTALKHIRAGKIIKRQGMDAATHKPFWYFIYLDTEYLKHNPVARDAYFFPIKYKNEFSDLVYDWQPLQADLFSLQWEIAKFVRKKSQPEKELAKPKYEEPEEPKGFEL
jgi:hypothetical protein